MASKNPHLPEHCNVVIIGGGPAGLATATELARLGVGDVVVLEREFEAGGVPRHCGHPPFGMREFKRIYTGPEYARRLVERAHNAAVTVWLKTTVVSIAKSGVLELSTPEGMRQLKANKVVLSTGVRETPRAARLISGQRPLGITTTGALQSMVYLEGSKPFKRPVIVGSELVSFSALLTCRHAGIKPVALLEQNNRISARSGAELLPRLLGIPLHLNTELVEIQGKQRVTGVRIKNPAGNIEDLECDGVVFSGQFTPESTLMRLGHLQVDPLSGGPEIDQFGRCSDPVYFATGNLLRPVETAGWCWNEGVQTARHVSMSLAGQLGETDQRIPIVAGSPLIKYVVPQILSLPLPGGSQNGQGFNGTKNLQLRFLHPARGRLSLHSGSTEIQAKSIRVLPERRILLPLPQFDSSPGSTLHVRFDQA